MIVSVGVEVGFAIVASSKLVIGNHAKVSVPVPPLPVGLPPIWTDCPIQMAVSGPASVKGNGLTMTTTVSVGVEVGLAIVASSKSVTGNHAKVSAPNGVIYVLIRHFL